MESPLLFVFCNQDVLVVCYSRDRLVMYGFLCCLVVGFGCRPHYCLLVCLESVVCSGHVQCCSCFVYCWECERSQRFSSVVLRSLFVFLGSELFLSVRSCSAVVVLFCSFRVALQQPPIHSTAHYTQNKIISVLHYTDDLILTL